MERRYRYFVIEGDGPVKNAVDSFMKQHSEFCDHIETMVHKFKAKSAYVSSCILGLTFPDEMVVPEGWRQNHKYPGDVYVPDKRSKSSKADNALLLNCRKPDWLTLTRKANTDMVIIGNRALVPTFERHSDDCIIWRMPLDDGGNMAKLDTTGIREIKTSEYWALKEKLEEQKG